MLPILDQHEQIGERLEKKTKCKQIVMSLSMSNFHVRQKETPDAIAVMDNQRKLTLPRARRDVKCTRQ
ncbi:hypothetical protein ACEQPO_02305 [Bacillus sp. SL00103]